MRLAEVNKSVEFIAPSKPGTKNRAFRLLVGSFLLKAMTAMVLATVAALLCIYPCQASSAQKPHIVLIVADDLVTTKLEILALK